MISVPLLDRSPSCARRVYSPPALLVLLGRFFFPFLPVAPNSVPKCKLDTFSPVFFFVFPLSLFQDHASNLSHRSHVLMLGCTARLMPHHFDRCFVHKYKAQHTRQEDRRSSRLMVISSGNLFCVCQKTRWAEQTEYIGFLFHFQTLQPLAAPLSNLQGERQQSRRVCLNPLLCFLIKRRAGVRTHYFPHASPPSWFQFTG